MKDNHSNQLNNHYVNFRNTKQENILSYLDQGRRNQLLLGKPRCIITNFFQDLLTEAIAAGDIKWSR